MAYKKAVGTEYIPQNYTATDKKQNKKVKASRKYSWIVKVSPVMAAIALIFIIGMGFVAQHVWINFLGYQISELKQEISDLQVNNEKLKLKIAGNASLETIENIAKTQLGMINPAAKSVHYIVTEGQTDVEPSQKYKEILAPVGENTETSQNKQIVEKAWLGTVEDFFYQRLFAK